MFLFTRTIIEELNRPVKVERCNEGGLVLASGIVLPVPGIEHLPCNSAALQQIIPNGVELTPAGRVVGLVRVWHWCGNDPVRKHIPRVDLGYLFEFLQEPGVRPRGKFDERGWNISEYFAYTQWLTSQHPEVATDAAT